jgi:hypothetical protein
MEFSTKTWAAAAARTAIAAYAAAALAKGGTDAGEHSLVAAGAGR